MDRCVAITVKGRRCKLRQYSQELCSIHYRMQIQGRKVQIDPSYLAFNRENIPSDTESIVTVDIDCPICFTNIDSQYVKCEKNHQVCLDCTERYFEIQCNDGCATTKCMITGCTGSYMCLDSLPEKLVQRIKEQDECNRYIQNHKDLPDFQLCPFCAKYGIRTAGYKKMICMKCHKEWCVKCRYSHPEDSCTLISNINDLDRIRHVVENVASASVVFNCSKCSTALIKVGGCNLITCVKCSSHVCYYCGILVPPRWNGTRTISYYHFKGSGSADPDAICPLYSDDVDRRAQACEKLLKENPKPVQKIMRQHIKQLGIAQQNDCCVLL